MRLMPKILLVWVGVIFAVIVFLFVNQWVNPSPNTGIVSSPEAKQHYAEGHNKHGEQDTPGEQEDHPNQQHTPEREPIRARI
jgi:hypothetical protein